MHAPASVCILARLHGQRSASFADDTCTWAWGAVVLVGSTATDGHKCQLVRLWTMLLLGYPSLAWLGGLALVGGRATCSSAANHRTCRLLDQQHRPAAACQILYGLACRTDEHAVQQLLPVRPAAPGGPVLELSFEMHHRPSNRPDATFCSCSGLT